MLKLKYELSPKYAAMRRTMANSHNRRVLLMVLFVMAFILTGVLLLRSHKMSAYSLLGAAVLSEIVGFVCIIRIAKKQSTAIGYACPVCGGALYDGKSNRLGRRGECPCCKQFIFDKLTV